MFKKLLNGLLLSVVFGNAQATLIDRGSGLIYDDVQNLTWLQDASYFATSGAFIYLTNPPDKRILAVKENSHDRPKRPALSR